MLTVGVLVGLGTSLQNSQTNARQVIESRFAERAKLSAALTTSLFASVTSSSQATSARKFGGARVSAATLRSHARKARLTSLVLLGADGKAIGRSAGTPDAILRALEAKPAFVRAALGGRSYALADVTRLPGGTSAIQFAQSFPTPIGPARACQRVCAGVALWVHRRVSRGPARERRWPCICARRKWGARRRLEGSR